MAAESGAETMADSERVVLITGIAGGLARMVGAELNDRGYQIVGVDYRRPDRNLGYEAVVYQANYNKTRIADIFRRHKPSIVLHLGRVGNLKERMGKRFDLNVIGSGKLMDLCLEHAARRLVVLSTFHIYGAHPHNHTPIYEDEPLRAGPQFPQIADAIQLDNLALTWIWRYPEVKTALLRPCNVVGPRIQNAMSRFLRQRVIPTMIGFNPMVQFLHEEDLVSAIVAAAVSEEAGVFNVAGRSPVPWKEAIGWTSARKLPVPTTVASLYLSAVRALASAVPAYMVNFFKYPCVISDAKFRQTFGWEPSLSEIETIRSTAGT
jgi:UDP-glucose 4-epimerase